MYAYWGGSYLQYNVFILYSCPKCVGVKVNVVSKGVTGFHIENLVTL